MKVEQIYTGCLAHGAYYIESNGEAAVIDPLRETQQYIDMAEKRGAKIKYVLETHFHADFVSGHLDLAKKTGAEIVYGPNAAADFDFHKAEDGEILELGDLKIKVLHTPGHTMESSCYLLFDGNGKEHSIFTGDTLFIGDVGRPDLAQTGTLTQEDLASYLYDSLRNKIMTLPQDVILYPGHGAGSACGKHMSDETVSTIGDQIKNNYSLRESMTKDEFIKEVTDGLLPPPGYFPKNVMMNKKGYQNFDDVLAKGTKKYSVNEFKEMASKSSTLILDTRDPLEFGKGFIPGSIHIGLDGNFAPWVGELIEDINQILLLVTDEGKEEEAVTRLARVGYDNVVGILDGGFEAWKNSGNEFDQVEVIHAEEFAELASKEKLNIVDVRRENEYSISHLKGAQNIPLNYVNKDYKKYDLDKTYYTHCLGGYRTMINSSILKSKGIKNVISVYDEFDNIQKAFENKNLEIA